MAILLESAAPAAQLADRAVASDRLVKFPVQERERGAKLGQAVRLHQVFGLRLSDHNGLFLTDSRICSTVKSCPWPDPGQIRVTCCQSSGVSTFSGQNGQVRH